MRNGHHKSLLGFTLVEIMISIFILSIIMTTVLGSYRSMFSNIDAIDKGVDYREMAKTCLNRMITDLQSVYISMLPLYKPPDFNSSPNPYRIIGDSYGTGSSSFPRLRFTSSAHISFNSNPKNGIAEIIYYVQGGDNAKFVLKRQDNLEPFQHFDKPFEEKKSDPVLCEDIKSFSIKYYDYDGREYDEWNSESDTVGYATPKGIDIKLEIKNEYNSFSIETKILLPVCREQIKKN